MTTPDEKPTGKLRWRTCKGGEEQGFEMGGFEFILQQEWAVHLEEKDRITGLHFQARVRFEWRDVEIEA